MKGVWVDKNLLNKIVSFSESEEGKRKAGYYNGYASAFEWWDVGIKPQHLNSLVIEGIVDIVFKSNNTTMYGIRDIESIKRLLIEHRQDSGIPNDLFEVIEGYDDVKGLIMKSLKGKITHFLLYGSPATAKSLFLYELEKLPNSVFVCCSSSSRAGLFEVMDSKDEDIILLLDEIEKVKNPKDLSVLLSVMERGVLSKTMHNSRIHEKRNVWVFATANSLRGLSHELLSRFVKLKFKEYSDDEFLRVSKNVLVKREGAKEDIAEYIAKKVLKYSKDVRECIKVFRLDGSFKDVDDVIDTLKRYSDGN